MVFGVFLVFSTLNTPFFYPIIFTIFIIVLLLIKYSILSYSKIYIDNNLIVLSNLLNHKKILTFSYKNIIFYVPEETYRTPHNTVSIKEKYKNLIRIRLNSTQWEFERFLHYSKQHNAQWKFREDEKKSHDQRYKMYLSRLELKQKNKPH